jgi:hypothetical protein
MEYQVVNPSKQHQTAGIQFSGAGGYQSAEIHRRMKL